MLFLAALALLAAPGLAAADSHSVANQDGYRWVKNTCEMEPEATVDAATFEGAILGGLPTVVPNSQRYALGTPIRDLS